VLFVAGLGVPIPEEVPVIASGALAHESVVRWWIALPVCLLGVLAGDTVLYWVGHHWGERILDWRLVRHVLRRQREAALLDAYRRHGVKIVFLARHVTGVRAAAFLTAGIARIPFWKFLAVDGVAALIGVPITFGLAFLFTDQIREIMAGVHRVERWLLLLVLVGLAAGITFAAWRRASRETGLR
jgi:membrane protein DedA with SNARE-associated domain